MTEENRPLPVGLHDRRDEVVAELTRHFVAEHLDADEFEARVEQVYQTRTIPELEAIRSNLPVLPTADSTTIQTVTSGESVGSFQIIAAFMGGTVRRGGWTPARQISALAMMGGLEIDFREARFGPGTTDLNVLALMGGVEIIVPPGLRVECEGIGLMGGFDSLDQHGGGSGGGTGPTLRIRGAAVMGGVEITQRLPGETAKDRKRRIKDEKVRKRLSGGR